MSSRDLVVAAAGASAPSDPNFKNVSMLLTGDGTNGAQNNTFLDSSTNNFTITRNGNTTQGTFSPYGNLWSNYINGTGNSLTFTATSAMSFTGDMTVEAWVYLNSYAGSSFNECTLLSLRTGSSTGSQFDWGRTGGSIAAGAVDWWNYGAPVCQGSVGDIPLNQWAHVAYVRSGSGTNNCKVYVNGVLKAQGTYTGTVGVSSGTCHIGNSMFDQPMNGYVSNLRVTNTAVYTTAFTPPTTPLTAVSGTSLLTCQSNRFIDNSSNNFTLTVNGNPSVQRFSPFNPTAPYSASTIGGSGYFDGTGDYLAGGSNTAFNLTGDFDVEFWFYPNSSISTGLMALCGTNASAFYDYIILNNGNVEIYGSGGAMFIATFGSTIKQSSWNHFAFTRSGTTVRCFINGVLLGSNTTSSALNLSYGNGLTIGGVVSGSTTYMFNGYMSNFRIVKGTAVYTSNFTPPTAPLTAITNTSLLLNFTNAGIPDAAMMNDLETVGNAQVSTSVKKYGTGSLAFDGTGDYLQTPSNPSIPLQGDFTVEAWIYPTAINTFGMILGSENGAASDYLGISTTRIITAFLTGGSTYPEWSYSFSTNQWYHIAITRSGSTLRAFVNGNQLTLASGSATNTQQWFISNVPLSVGRYGNTSSPYYFNGYIDDLRITKGYARYTTNFTPPAQALPTN